MMEPIVLLVDDEAPFIETMTKRLSKRKLKVSKALSGEEALEALEADNLIDVVILDVKMPGMDGIETLKEIRRAFPLVEVIMLTGHATVETSIEGMRLGAFDYLMKPCDMDVLMEKVAAATQKKRGHEEKIRQARVNAILKTRT
jgi:DNA-binding NtrC family response regulator